MTDEHAQSPTAGGRAQEDGNPFWEEELRRGQTLEGEAGSVEHELTVVRLLRHSVRPPSLAPDELASGWQALEASLAQEAEAAPGARRWWLWAWALAGVAAGGVAWAFVSRPSSSPTPPWQALESQFAILQGPAAERRAAAIDDQRHALRRRALNSMVAEVGEPR